MFLFYLFADGYFIFEFILSDLISKTTEVVPSEYRVIQKYVRVSLELEALHTSGLYRGTVGPPLDVSYPPGGGGGR